MNCLLVLLAGVVLVAPASAQPAPDFSRARAHVLERQDEGAWRRIPWRASFWAATLEADAKKKPILLWAMNGHPLGCT